MKKDQQKIPETNTNTPDGESTDAAGQGETQRTTERTTTMREANENIRKAQGEDGDPVGPHPTIDRHR